MIYPLNAHDCNIIHVNFYSQIANDVTMILTVFSVLILTSKFQVIINFGSTFINPETLFGTNSNHYVTIA